MTATKDEITEALKQLDSGNDEHWTDDGLPRIDAVRSFTKDPSLKRTDITAAAPGFSRAGTQGDSNDPEASTKLPGDPPEAEGNGGVKQTAPEPDALLNLSDEDLHVVMKKRVDDAMDEVLAARQLIQDAMAAQQRAERKHARTLADLIRRFPPISEAQAIKDHLARQQQYREEEAKQHQLNPGLPMAQISGRRAAIRRQFENVR